MDPKNFFLELEAHNGRLDLDLITKAYEFSERAHEGQKRKSGEPYISHCLEVAKILLELRLGTVTVVSGLVHDVVEDTEVTIPELENQFGREVATIVDGVTKIGGLKFSSVEERQVENYRKMLLSMAKDVRIILVKFADRLHNMRTLEYLSEEKQHRIAMETREVYAPLAHRFGVARMRWELEDLAFKYLEPEAYRQIAKQIAQKRREREKHIKAVSEPLIKRLEESEVEAEVTGRAKHLYSVHRKMVKRNKPFEEIYDLLAIRVLTESVQDCYHVLGLIHSVWTPLQDRFKDYIATPKSNMYQALHTTVSGPEGRMFEIQIRTREMHRTAEYGIAAHWRYKEDRISSLDLDEKLVWLRQVLDWQRELKDPKEFMEYLRIDLFREEVFAFTPKGDLKKLPAGSTPIDFAFAVHTEVGYRCAGAKVNGRIVPLHYELKSGDYVEILTNSNQRPSKDWVNFVKTSSARSKIRHWVREQELDSSIAIGKELLDKEFKRNKRKRVAEDQLLKASAKFNFKDIKQLYAALGRGDISIMQYWNGLFPDSKDQPKDSGDSSSTFERIVEKLRGTSKGIRVQGVDNLMIRYAQCCQPVPGDDVMGYITRGRGISIHRTNCPNVLKLTDTEARRIDIDWAPKKSDSFLVRLLVRGTDRKGLFADVAKAISNTSTNIHSAILKTREFEMWGRFVVQIDNLDHLQKVIKGVRKVPGILEVERREYVASPGTENVESEEMGAGIKS